MKLRHALAAALAASGLAIGTPALAHCDTLDGPVVSAARKALETGDLRLAMVWTRPDDEAELRRVFDLTRAVRGASPAAKELADRYFFETVVRVHRAGEAAPYTGLKPAGAIEAPVLAADQAIATGKLQPVAALLSRRMHERLDAQFRNVMDTRHYDPKDVAAGRAHVAAYVQYVHFVERMHGDAQAAAHGQEASNVGHAH